MDDKGTEHLSDYSEDFEEDDSSRGVEAAKPSVLDATPKHGSLKHTRLTRTDPVPRKAKSNYSPAVSKLNWRKGKGRAFSERDIMKRAPRGTPFSPRDRELSAKQHTIKILQSRLTNCQRELSEMKKENKFLNRLQVRQERELNRVSTQEGELPQILARHTEEVRVLKEQLKRSQENNLTHQDKVRGLQSEIQRLNERRKKLEQVAKRKHLLERESLTVQLQEANDSLRNKDRKVKELEKGMEALNKTHGQEVKMLMHKSKLLSQEAEEAKQRFDRAQAQLKERVKEMDVMNIYSQRIGKSIPHTFTRPQAPIVEDNSSQTNLSCAPHKTVSMQTKQPLKSSSSQTHAGPTLQTSTTQTEIDTNTTYPSPQRETKPIFSPPRETLKSSLAHQSTSTQPKNEDSPEHSKPLQPHQDEEQQKKDILLARLRALDSQKGPPASQPMSSVVMKSSAEPTSVSAAVTTQPARPPPAAVRPVQDEEAQKKKLLLAKLLAIDDGNDPKTVTVSKMNVTEPAVTGTSLVVNNKSSGSNSSLQSWPDTIDNMHKGKPAFATEDDPFGSRNTSGKRLSGLLNSNSSKSTIKARAVDSQQLQSQYKTATANPTDHLVTDPSQGYKPTFGRRSHAHETNTGPLKTLLDGGLDAESRTREKETTATVPDFSANQEAGKRDYPWEKRVNLDTTTNRGRAIGGYSSALEGQGNKSMVFGPKANTRSSLLPLRAKADLNVMPGSVAEPDDLEELVL